MTPEGAILKSIGDWLTVSGYWWMRINTAAVFSEYKGKKRMFRAGRPGMADLLVLSPRDGLFIPYWIEVKTSKGKQSESQELFEIEVLERGHRYGICRSIEDAKFLLTS